MLRHNSNGVPLLARKVNVPPSSVRCLNSICSGFKDCQGRGKASTRGGGGPEQGEGGDLSKVEGEALGTGRGGPRERLCNG